MKNKIFIAMAAIGILSLQMYAQDNGVNPKDLFGDIGEIICEGLNAARFGHTARDPENIII